MNSKDALIIALIMVAFFFAGTFQFKIILGLEISHKTFVMPIVMGVVFSIVVTRLRGLQRALDAESAALKKAKEVVSALNSELSERLDARTQLLTEVRDQLRVAQQRASISALSAGVIHDLNNTIMIINVTWEELEDLRERLGEGAISATERFQIEQDMAPLYTEMREGIQQALSFTQSFHSFIRPQQDKSPLTPIAELTSRLIPFLKRSFNSDQKLSFQWESEQRGCVEMNALMLTQVIMNLVVNARDALGGASGEVKVSARCFEEVGRGWVYLSVSDTGCGMSPEVQAKIFEPFFTTKAKGEGTGLGLHVLIEAVRSVGGTVDLLSTEGVGTRFVLKLPCQLEGCAPTLTADV